MNSKFAKSKYVDEHAAERAASCVYRDRVQKMARQVMQTSKDYRRKIHRERWYNNLRCPVESKWGEEDEE